MKSLLLGFSLLSSVCLYSQIDITRDVFASSGSEMSSSDLLVNFTLGEVFTSTFDTGSDIIMTMGFQQGELSLASLHEFSNEQMSLFPNPADNLINFHSSSDLPFTYFVYDVTGRIILNGQSLSGTLILNLSSIVEGKYILEYRPLNGEPHYLPFITIH